jgi:phosphoglycerol transferase MdoB-like AlkP superfamily enzyme
MASDARPRTLASQIGIGLVLLFVVAFLLLMIATAVMMLLSTSTDDSPFKGTSPAVPFITAAILAALILLLGRLAIRLAATMRGREPENLLPLWAQCFFSLFFGISGLAALGSAVANHRHLPLGTGAIPMFLSHAWWTAQKMFRRGR